MSYGNEPSRKPDLVGAHGRAWRVVGPAEGFASVGADWLVHAPHAHTLWWWYAIGAVHLRAQEGVPAPHVRFEGATHEILFLALNPEKPLPSVDDWQGMAWLEPVDLAHQLALPDDQAAAKLVRLAVRAICKGASPDCDHRGWWIRVFDGAAELLRKGRL